MNVIIKAGGKILVFVWRNRSWIVPVVTEGYQIVKRWRKINKLKRAEK